MRQTTGCNREERTVVNEAFRCSRSGVKYKMSDASAQGIAVMY